MAGEAARTHTPAYRAWWLVAKAGLIEHTDDDRAVIFGILVEAAAKLRSENGEQAMLLWRRRGKRTFDGDADQLSD